MSQYPVYYPVSLNVSGRDCVVVGGGQVALRKVRALLECGARVTVVSPTLCGDLQAMAAAGEVHLTARAFTAGDLQGVFLAIAATDDNTVNAVVATEARKAGVLANVVDDAAVSDFITPSNLRRGGLTISVSTSGMSPALARCIRMRLEQEFGAEYEGLLKLVEEVRQELKARGVRINADAWQNALGLHRLIGLLRSGGVEKARAALVDALPGASQMR